MVSVGSTVTFVDLFPLEKSFLNINMDAIGLTGWPVFFGGPGEKVLCVVIF